jgi:hypothetical protein
MKKTVAAVLSIMVALVFAVSTEASDLKKRTTVKEFEMVEVSPIDGNKKHRKLKKEIIKEERKSKTEKLY